MIVITYLLISANLIELIDSKKILLGLIGLHALKRMHEKHSFIRYLIPLKYATDAWKKYGEVAGGQGGYKLPKLKMSYEEGHRLDKWIGHYYPDDGFEFDNYK